VRKLIYGLIAFLAAGIGLLLAYYLIVPVFFASYSPAVSTAALIAAPVFFGLIGFLLAPKIYKLFARIVEHCISHISTVPTRQIVSSVAGLILGLIIAALIGSVVTKFYIIGPYISVVLMVFFGYLGAVIGYKRTDDLAAIKNIFQYNRSEKSEKAEKSDKKAAGKIPPKILDTSVIIDGRIADIYKTGFIEGELIIPGFVLEELRHIADSSDVLKRNRGRRGLDILNRLRNDFGDSVRINEKNYADISEVDSKLLKMAQELHGIVLTNDFNLNKVARFQGVKVLNINELSNAVKPVVLPGEEMIIEIIKEGKEQNQGVAYLDDGTMIVVENGKNLLGKTVYVIVTSVLQTAAGKMIFARPKLSEDGRVWEFAEAGAVLC